jgi:hypothetical protein
MKSIKLVFLLFLWSHASCSQIQPISYFEIDKGWALLDSVTLQPIIPFGKFDYAYVPKEGFMKAYSSSMEKWGYTDLKGDWVIKPEYDNVNDFQEGFAMVSQEDKTFFINTQGKKLTMPTLKFNKINDFSSGLALVSEANYLDNQEGKTGVHYFINPQGKVVIDLSVSKDVNYATPFYQKFAVVGYQGSYFDEIVGDQMYSIKLGVINQQGKWIVPQQYDAIEISKDGKYIVVKKENKSGLYDAKGKLLIPIEYDALNFPSEGLVTGRKGDFWTFLDLQNKSVSKEQFQGVNDFMQGSALVKQQDKYAILDRKTLQLSAIQDIVPTYFSDILEEEINSFWIPYQEKGLWGGINLSDKVWIEPQYEAIYNEESNLSGIALDELDYIPAKKNGKWGIIQRTGKTLIDFQYDAVLNFASPVFTAVKKGDKWAFVDWTGKQITPFQYENVAIDRTYYVEIVANPYSGYYHIQKNGKWGLINRLGQETVPCIYDKKIDFSKSQKGLAIKSGKYGVIDYQNKEILPFEFDEIKESSSGGFMIAQKGNQMGIIDQNGKTVLDFKYDKIQGTWGYSELLVTQQGKQGILDKQGKVIIPTEYDSLKKDYRDFIHVKKDNKWGFYAHNCMLAPCEYDFIGYFDYYNRAIAKKNGKYGVIDSLNKVVLDFKYDAIDYQYSEDDMYILAQQKGKWGAFSTQGKAVIPLAYNELGKIIIDPNRPMGVMNKGKWGYINSAGKQLIAYQFENASRFDYVYADESKKNKKPYALVKKAGKWGVIDVKGKIVIPIEYDYIEDLPYDVSGKMKVEKDGKAFEIDLSGKVYQE